ncbi:MAG: CPBP family intramembrane metalloprotease [Planctomycetes bacterium]|nr:CPBP family intramembrane metalloprotease [Planctomycetota bacterium]
MDEQADIPVTAVPEQEPPAGLDTPPPPAGTTVVELLVAVGIIWGIELFCGIISSAVLLLSGPRNMLWSIMASTILSWGATLGLSWYFVCRRHGKTVVEGFALKNPGARPIVWGVAVSVAIAMGGLVLMSHFSTGKGLLAELAATPAGLAFVVCLSLLAPLVEEPYYRGLIFPVARKTLGGAAAVPIVALWFTAAHFMQLFEDPVGLAVILVIAVQYTLQKHLHGSLVPSLVSHLVYNAVVIAAYLFL